MKRIWVVATGNRQTRCRFLRRGHVMLFAEHLTELTSDELNAFLSQGPQDFRFALLLDLVPEWDKLGADAALLEALREVTSCEKFQLREFW